MSSSEPDDGDRIVELIVRDASDSTGDADADAVAVTDDFAHLLTQPERPRINIFNASYPRRKSRCSEVAFLSGYCIKFYNSYYGINYGRLSLHEKLKIADIAGLACSLFGVIFFFHEMLATQGQLIKAGDESNANFKGSHIFALLLGLVSSISGGTSYCLVRAGAKASDQPLTRSGSDAKPFTLNQKLKCKNIGQAFDLMPYFSSFLI